MFPYNKISNYKTENKYIEGNHILKVLQKMEYDYDNLKMKIETLMR